MKNSTCFPCHKPGHNAAYCKTKPIQSNQQRMQQKRGTPQASKWTRQSFTRYTNHFHGYCYACNNFGHKIVDCKMYSRRGKNYYTSAQMYFDKIGCYLCLKLGQKENDCKMPYILKNSRQMMVTKQIKQNYEFKRSANIMKNPNKVWKEKRKGKPIISIT